jgi:hypothetical protein
MPVQALEVFNHKAPFDRLSNYRASARRHDLYASVDTVLGNDGKQANRPANQKAEVFHMIYKSRSLRR